MARRLVDSVLALAFALSCSDAPAGGDEASDDEPTSTPGSVGDDASGGELAMFCQPLCETAADCCPDEIPPGIECLQDFPFVFECPDGVCRPGGCQSDADCEYFMEPSLVCLPSQGVGLCREPCEVDDDCDGFAMFGTCDGVSEDGTTYCTTAAPGACDEDGDCNDNGACVDGMCACVDDGECMQGWGCTPSW